MAISDALPIENNNIDVVLSDQLQYRPLQQIKEFRHEYFLFSVFPLYPTIPKNSKRQITKFETLGIHKYSQCDGQLLLDSGGFQLYRNKLDLSHLDTLNIYDKARLQQNDFGISLDFVPFPEESSEIHLTKIQKSNATFQKMVTINPKIVPVIHGWDKTEMQLSLSQLQFSKYRFFTYGSCFPMITKYNKANLEGSIKQRIIENFLTFLKLIREQHLDDWRIHILGANGQNSSHLCWYAGCDQTDSGSWRLKAAYGKIAFVGINEAKISDRESSFGVVKWKDSHDALLLACECPACKGLSLTDRKTLMKSSFRARCIHNAFIFLEERELGREMVGTLRYEPYLEKRFRGTWWLKFLQKVREGRHQKDITQYFKI
jgi:7-cyano-7-deazaguanine tRNA-ribosyltransferase